MKKLLSCLFAIIILAISVIPCFAASPSLSVSASDYAVKAGDVIRVTVSLSGNSGLTALTFVVSYNANEFEYINDSEAVGGIFQAEYVNASNGSIVYDGISEGATSPGGTALSFKLRVKNNGGKVGGKISVSVNTASDTNDAVVKVSGASASISCDHSKMKWEEKFAPTCIETGMMVGTCTCGYSSMKEIDKVAHTYTSSVIKKPATCTETGIKVGTCSVCGAENAESKIPATGHQYTEWVVKQEATAETVGIKERTCMNCGDVTTQTIPVLIEGITPEDITQQEESSTETTTEFEPIITPEITTEDNFEYETETTTVPSGIFTNAVGSDIAIIAVIALAILVVIVLVMYIVLIIRQKKK